MCHNVAKVLQILAILAYLLTNFGFDTAENEPFKVR